MGTCRVRQIAQKVSKSERELIWHFKKRKKVEVTVSSSHYILAFRSKIHSNPWSVRNHSELVTLCRHLTQVIIKHYQIFPKFGFRSRKLAINGIARTWQRTSGTTGASSWTSRRLSTTRSTKSTLTILLRIPELIQTALKPSFHSLVSSRSCQLQRYVLMLIFCPNFTKLSANII